MVAVAMLTSSPAERAISFAVVVAPLLVPPTAAWRRDAGASGAADQPCPVSADAHASAGGGDMQQRVGSLRAATRLVVRLAVAA